jgi:formylglycine-generating enzyme required for sulfatase activity
MRGHTQRHDRSNRASRSVIAIGAVTVACADLLGADFGVSVGTGGTATGGADAGLPDSAGSGGTVTLPDAADGSGGTGGTSDAAAETADGAADSGGAVEPSCVGLTSTCGPTQSDGCCSSDQVPGGTFYRGQQLGANLGNDDGWNPAFEWDGEGPEHQATVPGPYRLDRYEVTVGRFRNFVKAYPMAFAVGAGEIDYVVGSGWQTSFETELPSTAAELTASLESCVGTTWSATPGSTQMETRPINCVNWYVAFAFCAWDGGRLPTEAEWEFAAANGSHDWVYPFGISFDPIPTCFDGNHAGCHGSPRPVGQFVDGQGPFGQHDLGGNVWEWMYDWKGDYPAPACSGAGCVGQVDNGLRAVRSGSFENAAGSLRAARRGSAVPASHGAPYGFRCVRPESA